jgi:hypothetical protein
MHTRTYLIVLLAMTLFLFLPAVDAVEKLEKPKEPVRIAVAQVERITGDLDYEKVRLLGLDKETRDALRQINQEIKQVRTEVLTLTDELKLVDYQKKLEFLNRKKSIIYDRTTSRDTSRDVRKLVRDFIIERYKDKYVLILNEPGTLERSAVYKAVVIDDITDEAGVKFREYLNDLVGE